jgi:Rhomboid-like protein
MHQERPGATSGPARRLLQHSRADSAGAGPSRGSPRLLPPRELARRYGVAFGFLALFVAGEIVTAVLSPHDRAALQLWASTNVANLHHHPVPALIVSAFLAPGSLLAWLALIPLGMSGANRAFGNWRLLVVCAAGHVIGTAVSEGIVDYRVSHGHLAASWDHIIDIGPSYVVVSAIVIAWLFGSWPGRIAAAVAFLSLVFIGGIFSGLTRLHVAPVGHLTAMLTALLLGVVLARNRPRP